MSKNRFEERVVKFGDFIIVLIGGGGHSVDTKENIGKKVLKLLLVMMICQNVVITNKIGFYYRGRHSYSLINTNVKIVLNGGVIVKENSNATSKQSIEGFIKAGVN